MEILGQCYKRLSWLFEFTPGVAAPDISYCTITTKLRFAFVDLHHM
jgi:hypothetical protein